MAFHVAVNLLLGAASLLLLLPLRAGSGRTRQLVLGFALGLAAGILAINLTTSALHASRDSELRAFEKYAWRNADPSKAQVLVIGSSLTALGVDNDLITRDLKAKGYPVQVLNLAKVGTMMISQDDELDEYLARAKKIPEFVFIEVGPEYWTDTGAIGPSDAYTSNAIADHGIDQFASRAKSIAAYPGSPAQKFNEYWDLASYTLFNAFDFGLSGQLATDDQVRARNGFLVRQTRRHHVTVTKAEVDEVVKPAGLLFKTGPLPESLRFVLGFRRMQIAKLKARGVKVVGFFQPEVPSLVVREYGLQVCHELQGVPCIIADDPVLQRKLDNPAMWYDRLHLLRPGAEIYSEWLAGKFAAVLAPYRAGTL